MRLATLALVGGVLLLTLSLAVGADAETSGPTEKYRYDIYVDNTPYGSPDGETINVDKLQQDVREIVIDYIDAEPLIDFKNKEVVYVESKSKIAIVDYIEYRGLYYRVNVVDHGLVEVTDLSQAFTPYAMAGVWGLIMIMAGIYGFALNWFRRSSPDSKQSSQS